MTVRYVIACAALIAPLCALAQSNYPTRPIRLIIPFPPAGAVDILSRTIAPKLGESLGQQIVTDNRSGAAGNIAAEIAAKAQPDGYTLLMGYVGHPINMTLYAKPGYDVQRDFAPVTLTASSTLILLPSRCRLNREGPHRPF